MRDCAMAHDDAPKFGNQNRHLRIPQYADDLDRYQLLDEALEETFPASDSLAVPTRRDLEKK